MKIIIDKNVNDNAVLTSIEIHVKNNELIDILDTYNDAIVKNKTIDFDNVYNAILDQLEHVVSDFDLRANTNINIYVNERLVKEYRE